MDSSPMRSELVGILRNVGHRVMAGVVGGFICGFVIGGVGGRLAMFILRLTTDTNIAGIDSDDGFVMGSFTGATLFLVASTSFLGAFGGVVYAAVSGWVPEGWRQIATALILGLTGGAAIIRPGGVDFTVVGPAGLAIALFVLLPGLYGFVMSSAVERLLKRPPGRVLPWLGLVAGCLALLLVGGGCFIVLGLIVLVLVLAFGVVRFPSVRKLPNLPAVVWTARAALTVVGCIGAFLLINDIIDIV